MFYIADLFEVLRRSDTPSVCNAIEIVQGKRGFDRFTKNTMLPSFSDAPPIVGYARTAKIAGAESPKEPGDIIRKRRMDYFRAMAAGPRPGVCVVEDLDYPDCIAAWWGEVHSYVHKGLGLAGALTNGVMRDLGAMASDFPVIAGSVGPSHGFVHVREIGTPVEVFGLKIREGDLIHADRHGAVVIPEDIAPALRAALEKLERTEAIVLDAARAPDFDIAKLETAWARFEKARV